MALLAHYNSYYHVRVELSIITKPVTSRNQNSVLLCHGEVTAGFVVIWVDGLTRRPPEKALEVEQVIIIIITCSYLARVSRVEGSAKKPIKNAQLKKLLSSWISRHPRRGLRTTFFGTHLTAITQRTYFRESLPSDGSVLLRLWVAGTRWPEALLRLLFVARVSFTLLI